MGYARLTAQLRTNLVGSGDGTDGAAASSGDGSGGGGVDGAVWDTPATSGESPPPREMHISCVLPPSPGCGRRMLVHGGKSGDALMDDVRLLCLESWTWAAVVASSCRRVGHAATMLRPVADGVAGGDGASDGGVARLVVFGGFSGEAFCNDLWASSAAGNGQMEEVPARSAPLMRFAQAAAASGEHLYIFGGSTPTGELNDLHEIQLS